MPLVTKRRRPLSPEVCTSPLLPLSSLSAPPSLCSDTDVLIPFCVSGTLVLVGMATLARDPSSLLFQWATRYATGGTTLSPPDVSGVQRRSSQRSPRMGGGSRAADAADREDDSTDSSDSSASSVSVPSTDGEDDVGAEDAPAFVLAPFEQRRRGPNRTLSVYPVGIFVDCDVHVFRLLVRLLQGYLHAIPDVLHAACALEAVRLGLTATWCRRYPPPPAYAFRGGGVSRGGLVCTSYIVLSRFSNFIRVMGASLEEPADRWTHAATVCVDLSEFVGVGVVSNLVTDYGADCRGVPGTAMYYNSGDVYWTPFAQAGGEVHRRTDALSGEATLPSSQTPSAARPPHSVSGSSSRLRSAAYGPDAAIRIVLDVARGTVLWERSGQSSTPIVQLWNPHADRLHSWRVAFAVVCSGKSTVRLEA